MTECKCNIKLWNVVKFAKRKVHLKQSKNTSLLSASAYSKQHNSVKFVKYIPEGDALVLQPARVVRSRVHHSRGEWAELGSAATLLLLFMSK